MRCAGAFLGRGAMGDVHEVVIQGHRVAHKRMVVRRKLGGKEKKEIEILKRLSSHEHMIQLLGTYTHRQFLGILLYPVAICDMHTFFEDVEAWYNTGLESTILNTRQQMLDVNQKGRLAALGYQFPSSSKGHYAIPAYRKIGCLVSAISYLHDQKIRHKDLKPSNILLSRDRLWLSDFGSATDFSLLSSSATDNERGTPRYFSPEVSVLYLYKVEGDVIIKVRVTFRWPPGSLTAEHRTYFRWGVFSWKFRLFKNKAH
jgi:serine/threonine protein kinase